MLRGPDSRSLLGAGLSTWDLSSCTMSSGSSNVICIAAPSAHDLKYEASELFGVLRQVARLPEQRVQPHFIQIGVIKAGRGAETRMARKAGMKIVKPQYSDRSYIRQSVAI